MYVVVCSIMNVLIKNVKVKTLFDNNVEIDCMSKKLTNSTQLFIRQKTNIIMINFIDECA